MLAKVLEIYKQMYKLLNLVLDAREHFPKAYKYAFGERLMMTGLECCELIQLANSFKDEMRVEYLHQFSLKFESFKLMLRLCRDRCLINERKFCNILELAGSIGAQATGWRKYEQNSQNANRHAD